MTICASVLTVTTTNISSADGLIGWADINGVLAIKPPGQGLSVVNWMQALAHANSGTRLTDPHAEHIDLYTPSYHRSYDP